MLNCIALAVFFSFFFHIGTQREAVVEEEILDVFYTLEEH